MLTIIRQRLSKKFLKYRERRSHSAPAHYYFGYGANIEPVFLGKRITHFEILGPAKLAGYKFSFNTPCEYINKGFGGVTQVQGETVFGTLYKIRKESLDLLDCLEWVQFNFYQRVLVDIQHDDEVLKAFIYIPTNPRENLLPSGGYMNLIVNMAKKYSLPESYIAYLEAFRTQDRFTLDHSFNLRDPAKKRFLPNKCYVLHDRLREKLCNLI